MNGIAQAAVGISVTYQLFVRGFPRHLDLCKDLRVRISRKQKGTFGIWTMVGMVMKGRQFVVYGDTPDPRANVVCSIKGITQIDNGADPGTAPGITATASCDGGEEKGRTG